MALRVGRGGRRHGRARRAHEGRAQPARTPRVYVGQTRSSELIGRLSELGFGECTNRGEVPPRRVPWFLDNGAFSDWRAKRAFDKGAFNATLARAGAFETLPDFVVLPDIVAGGKRSLRHSLGWLGRVGGFPPYLALQDGMSERDVRPHVDELAGLFVGGTLEWKIATGARWVRFAHEAGLPCHIGRCGVASRVQWARRIHADSLDSTLPLWSKNNLSKFVGALYSPLPPDLFANS